MHAFEVWRGKSNGEVMNGAIEASLLGMILGVPSDINVRVSLFPLIWKGRDASPVHTRDAVMLYHQVIADADEHGAAVLGVVMKATVKVETWI